MKTKECLWEKYMKSNPEDGDLFLLVTRDVEEGYIRQMAWEELAKRDTVSTYFLSSIVCFCDDFKEEAWQLLKKKTPTADDLSRVIRYCKNKEIKEEAKDIFKEGSEVILEELRYVLK